MSEVKLVLNDVGNELTFREGEALKLREPSKFIMEKGVISNPVTFAKHWINKDNNDVKKGAMIFDYADKDITYYSDTNSYYGNVVVGQFSWSPELIALGIDKFCQGKAVPTDAQTLGQRLRFYRQYMNPEEHKTLVQSLLKFKATVTATIEHNNENKGAKKISYEDVVKNTLPRSFYITMPVASDKNMLFEVEIMCDTRGGEVKVWLESPDLFEKYNTYATEQLDAQRKEAEKIKDLLILVK